MALLPQLGSRGQQNGTGAAVHLTMALLGVLGLVERGGRWKFALVLVKKVLKDGKKELDPWLAVVLI